MPDKQNIPSQLQKAPSGPLKFEPQDKATSDAVKDFLQQKSAEIGGNEPVPEPGASEPEPIERTTRVPANPEFDQLSPHDTAVSDALAIDQTVQITDLEREIFLKAVLNDEPVRLTVALYDNQFKVELRSRSTFEQRRVFDVLDRDRIEEVIPKDNIALMVTRMQCYLAVIMIERINGQMFSDVKLDPKGKMEEHCKILREKVAEKTDSMMGVRWNSVLTALRTFENKCAKMNTEALNEGFWKPQGSA
jgi:hypothetical protein